MGCGVIWGRRKFLALKKEMHISKPENQRLLESREHPIRLQWRANSVSKAGKNSHTDILPLDFFTFSDALLLSTLYLLFPLFQSIKRWCLLGISLLFSARLVRFICSHSFKYLNLCLHLLSYYAHINLQPFCSNLIPQYLLWNGFLSLSRYT